MCAEMCFSFFIADKCVRDSWSCHVQVYARKASLAFIPNTIGIFVKPGIYISSQNPGKASSIGRDVVFGTTAGVDITVGAAAAVGVVGTVLQDATPVMRIMSKHRTRVLLIPYYLI
jgi:hypothetical protein